GPEVLANCWQELVSLCQPIVVGDAVWMRWAVALVQSSAEVLESALPPEAPARADRIPCIQGTVQQLHEVEPGHITPEAARGAYDSLSAAIDWTMKGQADGIVTLPLHKQGL